MTCFRGRLALGRDSLNLPTVKAVYWVVTETPGYPDQWLYIDTWLQTPTIVLPWVPLGTNRQGQNKEFEM